MTKLLLKSFFQTFSVAGLDAISRSLGWLIILLLVGALLLSVTAAANISTFAEEFFLHLVFNLSTALGLLGSLVFSSYIFAPMSVLYGVLFQSRVARAVETKDYPRDPSGTSSIGSGPFLRGLRAFSGLLIVSLLTLWSASLFGSLTAIGVYLILAGWLLGRDQFASVASRYVSLDTAKYLRGRHSGKIWVAGVAIAAILLIPVVNLMMPVFATILMIHLYKHLRLARSSDQVPDQSGEIYAGVVEQYRRNRGS